MKNLLVWVVALLGLPGALPAWARDTYVGGELGAAQSSFASGGVSSSHTALAVGLLAGYSLNETFAIEAGIRNLGNFKGNTFSLDSYAIGVQGVGHLPLSDRLSLLGEAGVARVTATVKPLVTGVTLAQPTDQSKTGLTWGVGVEYRISPTQSVRASYQSYQYSALAGTLAGRIGFYSLGAIFRF